MYYNDFVIAVKAKEILRESVTWPHLSTVYMDFGTEYSLMLKNKHKQRAAATVKIDGTDVLNGNKIVVPANGNVILDRFMLNGDLSSGKRFKFVEVTDKAVQDPTSLENGIIEVTFYLEENVLMKGNILPQDPLSGKWREPTKYKYCTDRNCGGFGPVIGEASCSTSHTNKGIGGLSRGEARGASLDIGPVNTSLSCNAEPVFASMSLDSVSYDTAGATVEGSRSEQRFEKSSNFKLQTEGSILKLRILPTSKEPEWFAYCKQCGKKVNLPANYCPKCGTKLEK